jgi:hypothetical protein
MSADDLTTIPTPTPATAAPAMSPVAKVGIAVAIVVILVVAAWAYGRSSVLPERAAADNMRTRALLLESRTQVLDAQLSLYAANFGSAAQHLEYAKPPLAEASSAMRDGDQDELATKVDAALQQVMTARDLAAKLSLDANSKAGEASKLLADVISALPR